MAFAAILGLGSAAASIYGGMAARRVAKHAAEERARALKATADTLRATSYMEAEKIREQQPRVIGAQKAGYAASGVWIGRGSPVMVGYETIREINKDIYRTLWNAEMKARAAEAGANVALSEGEQIGKAAYWQGMGQGLSTLSNNFTQLAVSQQKTSSATTTTQQPTPGQ